MAWLAKHHIPNPNKYAVDNVEDWIFLSRPQMPLKLNKQEELYVKAQFKKQLEAKYQTSEKYTIQKARKVLRDSSHKSLDLFKYLKEEESTIAYREQVLDNIASNLTKHLENSKRGLSKNSVEKIVNVSLCEKSQVNSFVVNRRRTEGQAM